MLGAPSGMIGSPESSCCRPSGVRLGLKPGSPHAVGTFGSEPCAASSLIASTSCAKAARQSGVAPAMSSPTFPSHSKCHRCVLSRAFGVGTGLQERLEHGEVLGLLAVLPPAAAVDR